MTANNTQLSDNLFTDASTFATSRDGVWTSVALVIGLGLCYSYLASFFFQKSSNFPSINYEKSQWTYTQAKTQFRLHAKKLIAQGFEKVILWI